MPSQAELGVKENEGPFWDAASVLANLAIEGIYLTQRTLKKELCKLFNLTERDFANFNPSSRHGAKPGP